MAAGSKSCYCRISRSGQKGTEGGSSGGRADAYDWRLWIDTIDHGGFDLIAKPFCDVEEKLYAAARHWAEGRIRRRWDHFFQR